MSVEDLPVVGADSVFEDEHQRKVREARELLLAEEGLKADGTRKTAEEIEAEAIAAREAEARAELAAVTPTEPDPAVILAEQAEAARLKKLGPKPNSGVTPEMLENNPSNYRPPPFVSTGPEQIVGGTAGVLATATPAPRDTDQRQRWLCINDTGIRTGHPVFHSDAHTLGFMVRCPECGGMSVRKVMDGEVIAEDPVVVGG